ncbi:uncharacterized protein LOC128867317 [Anastrepha ludens]|uniref:uncharacterized protein LOC128867317 n=1 Tax=Anastrepha ludens TaxID=28586 RepID=UPI0023AE704B|nr:uncharacterized protein LOC128867317 [Anastrepha ludens]
MSFFANLARSVISSVCNIYITRKIAARFFGLVRCKNNKVQSHAKTGACPPPPRPGPSLRKATKVYGRKDCATHIPICGVKATALKNCKPRMWTLEMEKCCEDLCKWAHPRFDDLYYIPSDKRKMKYQRTWFEFRDTYIAPKEICCYPRTKYAQPKKRKPRKPVAAYTSKVEYVMNLLCRNRLSPRCMKISWPGCRGGRNPPLCKPKRPDCGPRKCPPFPSFSECRKVMRPPLRPVECACLKLEPPSCLAH